MGLIEGALLGLSLLISTSALIASLLAKREAHKAQTTAESYPGLTQQVIRVVNEVKDECENMWDKVESHLGRISRARSATPKIPQVDIDKLKEMANHVDAQDGPIMSNYPPAEEGGGSPRQALLARARRSG